MKRTEGKSLCLPEHIFFMRLFFILTPSVIFISPILNSKAGAFLFSRCGETDGRQPELVVRNPRQT